LGVSSSFTDGLGPVIFAFGALVTLIVCFALAQAGGLSLFEEGGRLDTEELEELRRLCEEVPEVKYILQTWLRPGEEPLKGDLLALRRYALEQKLIARERAREKERSRAAERFNHSLRGPV
jgi:hypothetical protein